MATKRSYTDQEKAVALAAYDACHNVVKAAKMCGVPRATLQRWVTGERIHDVVPDIAQVKKGEIADRLEDLAHLLIEAIPGKVEEAPMQAVSTSLGIAIDKMQLLRGKATSITDDASLNDSERLARLATLFDRARARRDGPAADEQPPDVS